MNLESALKHIRSCRERMDVLYLKPVFDEWVIVSFADGKTNILSYEGPRSESFTKQFHRDSGPLFLEMQGKSYSVGDFEFVLEARGSHFDACVRLGKTAYLLCNNTFGSMEQLRQHTRWREAQKPFVELTEAFRRDPLATAV